MNTSTVGIPTFPTFDQVYQGFAQQLKSLPAMAPKPKYSDAERVDRAITTLVNETHANEAVWLESCIRCGQCASACHFFQGTKDTKYVPLRKMELYRRIYRRQVGPFRWWYRLIKHKVTLQELEDLQELVYDSCSECGRCTMVCPMGIDIASLVHHQRTALVAAELVPAEMAAVAHEQREMGTVFGSSPEVLHSLAKTIKESEGIDIPLDKEKADVMVLSSAVDLVMNGNGLLATAKVMNHLGIDWTIRSDGFEAANFGLLSGDMGLWKRQADSILEAAKQTGAKTLVIAECGHAYPALRWNPMVQGDELPFEMLYMSEFLGRHARSGQLKMKPLEEKITFHDPCKTGRRGGAFEEPRSVLQAMDANLEEMPANQTFNWCCGGGAGIFLFQRATDLRDKAFKIKLEQVEQTGAEGVVVSCASCRLNFEAGKYKNRWDKSVHSLLELVAEHLDEDGKAPAAINAEGAAA